MNALSLPRRGQVAEQELVCDVSASPVASTTIPSMLFDSGDSAQEVRGASFAVCRLPPGKVQKSRAGACLFVIYCNTDKRDKR